MSLSWLAVERAAFDHLCHPGRRVVGWFTFWLDNLSLDKLGVGVDHSLVDGWPRPVLLPVVWVAERLLQERITGSSSAGTILIA